MARITTVLISWLPEGQFDSICCAKLPEWKNQRIAWRPQGDRSQESFARALHEERYTGWHRQKGLYMLDNDRSLFNSWVMLRSDQRQQYLDYVARPMAGTVQPAGVPVLEITDDQGQVIAVDLWQPTLQEAYRVDWDAC